MLIEFTEILHDLELKRAAALPPGERPGVDVGAVVADLPAGPELRVRDDDGAEQPYAPALAATLVADALSTLAVASGEAAADTAAARAIARAADDARRGAARRAAVDGDHHRRSLRAGRGRADRLRPLRRGQGARRPSRAAGAARRRPAPSG